MHSLILSFTILVMLCQTGRVFPNQLTEGGKNVCKHYQSKTVYRTVKTKVTTLQNYQTCCSKFITCWKKCKRSRVRVKVVTRTIMEMRNQTVLHCCNGYSLDASGKQCSKPICDPPCQNGGVCVEPDQCRCPTGFKGILCQNDINECLTEGRAKCSQGCINIPGSYICTCRRGFVPGDPASRTCKDIDECRELRTNPCKCIGGKCGNICRNTIGSYRCSCGDGYKLTLWNTCVDRNECIENVDICPQKCINTPGSYKCDCWKGFQWNQLTKKCEEINECSVSNGGCQHFCHNVFGGHVCSCEEGFKLAPDRLSCIDINECQWVTRCDPKRSECVNTPGNYYCKCKLGFKFLDSHGICIDRDECVESTALCNQKCINTFGSYKCGCEAGYYLDSDSKTCLDVDECKQARCDQVCVNTPGSFKCFCNQGYTLDIDEKTCRPKLCERVQPLFFGDIQCSGYTVGERCTFSCQEGYTIDKDITRECLPDGRWSLQQPRCIPNSCKQPRPPRNGKLLLPCEFSLNSTCPVSCVSGFVLRGPNLIKCELQYGNAEWDVGNVKCEEILVCKPNPCKHGGRCSIVTPTTYSCNCTGTGHEGQNCEVGIIDIDPIPKLKENEPATITVRAKPNSKVQLRAYPEDDSLTIVPDQLIFTDAVNAAQVTITSTESGLKEISYEISSEELYKTPQSSLVLVYDPVAAGRFRVNSLSSLISKCFGMQVFQTAKGCPNAMIYSSLPWFKKSNGLPVTNGVAVLSTAGVDFPLLVPGVDQSQAFIDSTRQVDYRPVPGLNCNAKTVTGGQLQYIAKMDVFAKDFITAFNKLSPQWFQLELLENLKTFSQVLARSVLTSGNNLKRKKHCSALPVDESSMFIVYEIPEQISMKINGEQSLMKTKDVFCLAVDLCRSETHIQFPKQYGNEVTRMLAMQEFSSLKWKLQFNAIGFGDTSRSDPRKCMKSFTASRTKILLGGSRIEYKSKQGINAVATGEMAVGFKAANGKEVLDLSTTCIDGHSLVESPTWKSTDLKDSIYEQNIARYSNIVKMSTRAASAQESVLSLIQEDGTVFKIKSGLRPMIKQSSGRVRFDVNYKVTEKSSSASEDSNFNKYMHLQTLRFALMDIESSFEMLFLPQSLGGSLSKVQNELKSMSGPLNQDLNELISHISDSKLVNEKVKQHFSKGKVVYNKVLSFVNLAKAAIDADTNDMIQNALTSWKDTLAELGKGMKVPLQIKTFKGLSVHFNGSTCLLYPCIDDTVIVMNPLAKESPWTEFCYDPSKTSFQIWETRSTILKNENLGKFLSVKPKDEFRLCVAVDGIKRGEFTGQLSLLGDSVNTKFQYSKKEINMPDFDIRVKRRYPFRVNATIKTTYRRWDMMSVEMHGFAGVGSKIVKKMQKIMDQITVDNFESLKDRQRLVNQKLKALITDKGTLQGKLNRNQEILKRAEEDYDRANRIYRRSKQSHDQTLRVFRTKQSKYMSLRKQLDAVCKIKRCPQQCLKIPQCKVCQKELFVPKTVPKCKEEFDNRSYARRDNYDSVCSTIVEDRRLKYTGNCKRPATEINEAKRIVKMIQGKIKANKSLTLEDAWHLELVDKAQGQKLRDQILKKNFFSSFPQKLKEGRLKERDFEKLRKYTNATVVKSVRDNLKQVKLSQLLQELGKKTEHGLKLTKEDIDRVRKYNGTLATILEKNGKLNEINQKLKSGGKLDKKELEFLKKFNPKLYEDLTVNREKNEKRREIFARINRKLKEGKLTSGDLDELVKVDPAAAKQVEEALKKQLRHKVEEMKSKLNNVSNAISSGYGGNDFAMLNKKLQKLAKGAKRFDKNDLVKLQERIRKAATSNGTVFERILQRIDLALEIQNNTGRSSDFHRSLKEFISTLGKFDLIRIFMLSEDELSKQLEDIQNWFKTVATFLEKLCSKCGKSCNNANTIKKVLDQLRAAMQKFQSELCEKNRLSDTGKICRFVRSAGSFMQRYDIMKIRDCDEIKSRLVKSILSIAEEMKNVRRSNAKVFEHIWMKSKMVLDIKKAYIRVNNELKSALGSSSGKIRFSPSNYKTIADTVSKNIRSGIFNLRETEYLVARESLVSFTNAIRLIPIEMKKGSKIPLAIPNSKKSKAKNKFDLLVKKLSESLINLCASQNGKEELKRDSMRLQDIIKIARSAFAEMLDSKDVQQLFSLSQKVAAVLEHILRLSERVKSGSKKCSGVMESPLRDLDDFLRNVKDLGMKSVKELSEDIRRKFGEIGSGIKAPIGKLVSLVEKLAVNMPSFDLPIIATMKPKNAKLFTTAFKQYLKMIADVFDKFRDIVGNCKKCTIEDVFGKHSLKSIAEKLDKKLKPLSKKIQVFASEARFSLPGAPMLFSSLEQVRTDLQRIYKSETLIAEESFKDIIKALDAGKEAIGIFEQGQFEFHLKMAGIRNKDISNIVKEFSKIKQHTHELYKKSKDPEIEKFFKKIENVLSMIGSFSDKAKGFQKGSVDQMFDTLKGISGLVKETAKSISAFYRSSGVKSVRYFEDEWMPSVVKSLDRIEDAKANLIGYTEILLRKCGIISDENNQARNLKKRTYSALYRGIKSASGSEKIRRSASIASRSSQDESMLNKITSYWRGIYEKVVGKINNVKARVLRLREKFDSYMRLYEDIKKTVDEVKSGPMSDIGNVKDSIDSLVDSIENYDLKKMVLADPNVLKTKLGEIKQLFDLTKGVFKKTDDIIRKCKSCSVESTLGYKYVKRLASKFEKLFTKYHAFMEDFTDKFSDAAADVRDINDAVSSLKNRFHGITKEKKPTSDALRQLANAFEESQGDLDNLQRNAESFAEIVLGKDVDLQLLRSSFNDILMQVGKVVNKSSVIARKVEGSYNEMKKLGKIVNNVENDMRNIKDGPLEQRIAVAKDISKGVKAAVKSLPKILESSEGVLKSAGIDSEWVQKFSSGVTSSIGNLEKVWAKTETLLETAEVVNQGKESVVQDLALVKEKMKKLNDAPWDKKIQTGKDVARDVSRLLDTTLNAIVDTSKTLNGTLTKEGLISSLKDIIGQENVAKLRQKASKAMRVLDDLEKGPITQTGKLTDSVDQYLEGLRSFDVRKALLSDPASFKEKVGEFQLLAASAGDILQSVSDITGICNGCGIDRIVGRGFLKKIAEDVTTTFEKLHENVTDIAERIEGGKEGLSGFLETSKDISQRFKKVFKDGKITSQTFKNAAGELKKSAENLQNLKDSSKKIFSAILNDKDDIKQLQAGFEKVVNVFSEQMKKGGVLTERVEKAYKTVEDIKEISDQISKDFENIGKGPVELKADLARKMLGGVQEILRSVPDFMAQSANVTSYVGLDSSWMKKLGQDVFDFQDKLESVFNKTDQALKAAGIVGGQIHNISESAKSLRKDFEGFLDLPIADKFTSFGKLTMKFDSILNDSAKTARAFEHAFNNLTGSNLNVSADIGSIGDSLSGFMKNVSKGVKFIEGVYVDIAETANQIKSGPIEKVGALKDSIEDYVDTLQNQNLVEILVQSPKFAIEKINDIKSILRDSGDVLKNVSGLVKKYCPTCELDNLFGKNFSKKVYGGLQKGLENFGRNVTKFLEKVSEGGQSVLEIANAAESIKEQVKLLENVRFDADGLKTISRILGSTSELISGIGNSSSNLAGLLFQKNKDLMKLTGKFEGLVSFVGNFVNSTGNFVDSMSGAMDKVDKIKGSFDAVKDGFKGVSEGPIEMRMKALENIANGLVNLTEGVPDLIKNLTGSDKLPGFIRGFGSQVRDLANGLGSIIANTKDIVADASATIESVNKIGNIAGEIGNSFNRIMKSPFSGKIAAVKDMIGQVQKLTGEVNSAAGKVSSAVKKLTGKSILTSHLFGNTTERVLNDISNAVDLVSDRYQKFQALAKTVSGAFKSISSDPVNFALNDLPKLFNQADDFITTIINDTKGIAEKLGVKLDGLNLDPALVNSAKEFYSFAKSTLGTIQSGRELFSDFKDLLRSKDFVEGMQNFQKVIKTGENFIDNLDDIGQRLFKEKWKGLKLDFQEGLQKVGESVGINLQKAGEMFDKGMEVAGDVVSIVSDVKDLLNIKKLNLDTGLKAAKSILGIAQKSVNLLNKLGADISTKALKSIGSKLNVVIAVYQIGKGIYDFIKWINEACDITYATDVIKKELRSSCLKEKISLETVLIPVENCEYVTENFAKGFGAATFCCEGEKCLYTQNPDCLKSNDRCVERRLQYLNTIKVDKDLQIAYREYEKAKNTMKIAEMDMRASELLRQRYEMTYNVSVAELRLNRLQTAEANANRRLISQNLRNLKKAVNERAKSSKIRFLKVEFSMTLFDPNIYRIPIKAILRDQNGSYKIVRFTMDFDKVNQSIKLSMNYLLRTLTKFTFTRKRRSLEEKQKRTSVKAAKCAEFKDQIILIDRSLQDLLRSVNALQRTKARFSRLKRTTDVQMSKTVLLARRQLVKEVLLFYSNTDSDLKKTIENWGKDLKEMIIKENEQECFNLKDCINVWLNVTISLLDSSVSSNLKLIEDLTMLSEKVATIPDRSSYKSFVTERIMEIEKLIKTLTESAVICKSPPVLGRKLQASVIAYIGEEITLSCSVQSQVGVNFVWYVNKTVLPAFDSDTLTIPEVLKEEEGTYHCKATNEAGSMVSNVALVSVKKRLYFLEHLKSLAIPRFDPRTVTLFCNASAPNDAVYSWWFKSFSGNLRKLRHTSPILDLGMARKGKNGIFWCEVSNGHMKLRGKKAIVSLVQSKRKSHGARLKMKGEIRGLSQMSVTNARHINQKLKDAILNRARIKWYESKINVRYQWDDLRRTNGKFVIDLTFTPTKLYRESDMDKAIADSQVQYKVQKIISGFLYDNADEILHVNSSNKGYVLKKSDADVKWDPEDLICSNGMGLDENSVRCDTCLPGQYDNGFSTCKECPSGTYQPRFGARSCTPCGSGLLTLYSGSIDHTECVSSDLTCLERVKIMLALDTSRLTSPRDEMRMKTFIQTFLSHFSITKDAAKLSLALYDDSARLETTSEGYSTINELKEIVAGIRFRGKEKRTDLMLDLAAGFFKENLDQDDYRNILFVMTTGPTHYFSAQIERKVEQLKELGVEIFHMSIGQFHSSKEAMVISSSPKDDHIFKINDYNELEKSPTVIANIVCNETNE